MEKYYTFEDANTIGAHYDQYAQIYNGFMEEIEYLKDFDALEKFLNTKPELVEFAKTTTVFDICCGTGLAADTAKKVGIEGMIGVDGSGESLKVCQDKYKETYKVLVGVDELPQ